MLPRAAARCIVDGCASFGNPACGGRCNGCAAGKPPARGERVVDVAAVLRAAELADDAATVALKLARSLAAARQYADGITATSPPQYVPFALQRKAGEEELLFPIAEGVYVGTEYAAADLGLLRGLGVSRVLNFTSGARTVPNFGESLPGWRYHHFPLEDRIGYPVPNVVAALREAVRLMDEARADGRTCLLHCSAGLCRSASAAMAWLMLGQHGGRLDLAGAVAAFTAGRGRPPACSPSYWSALVLLEREQRATAAGAVVTGSEEGAAALAASSGDSEPPSFDFTPWVLDDLSVEAGPTSLQLAPAAEVTRMLKEEAGWDADAVVRALLG